jgi:hypothetical protein
MRSNWRFHGFRILGLWHIVTIAALLPSKVTRLPGQAASNIEQRQVAFSTSLLSRRPSTARTLPIPHRHLFYSILSYRRPATAAPSLPRVPSGCILQAVSDKPWKACPSLPSITTISHISIALNARYNQCLFTLSETLRLV